MQDGAVRFAQELVAITGESGAEAEVARAVKERLELLAFDEVTVDRAGNVLTKLARRRGRGRKPVVLFDAHLDTVGVHDGGDWNYGPYQGTIADGRLYGRGAADMRGALAALVYGLAAVDRTQLEGEVWLCASVCEEEFEGAALKLALQAIRPDCVVIAEATDLNLAVGQRGRTELLLEVEGKAAHSAWPGTGRNAVSGLARAWLALETAAAPTHPRLGPAATVLTDVVSTPYPGRSVVPYRCRATLDRRGLPGEDAAAVAAALQELATAAACMPVRCTVAAGESVTYTGHRLQGPKHFPAWLLDDHHPLVQRALAALGDAGLSPGLTTYRFCTNGSAAAGELGIPTIGFGPGREEQAHSADEFVEVDALLAAARGYQFLAAGLSRESRQLSFF